MGNVKKVACKNGFTQFNDDYMKSYSDDSDAGYFLKVYFQYPGKFLELHNDVLFSLKEWKLKKLKNL